MIDRLEDLQVQLPGFHRVEREAEDHKGIGQTLNAKADGPMAHVGFARLRYGVVVDIDDAVEVARNYLGDIVELLEVVLTVVDEGRDGERSEIAYSSFVRGRIFDDLSAQVR